MGYTITLTLKDGQDRLTTKDIDLVNSISTVAAAQTVLDAIAADWPGISGLGLVSASLTVPMTLAATTPQDTSNFDEGALIKILAADGGKLSWRIPGPLKDVDGLFVYITSGEVDISDAGIVAWFANYLSAGGLRFTKYGQRVMAAAGGLISGKLEKA